jgi:hypothetical protein
VSGGSGHLAPRIGGKSHDKPPPPPELAVNQGQVIQPRVGSNTGSVESPITSQTFPPSNSRAHPPQPYQQPIVSPHQAHAVPYQNIPSHDPDLEKQQREFMKKKREEAIRRRMEQEAREEAAKQARIAEKLKALGPAPERKSEKKDSSSVIQRTDIPAALAARSKATSEATATPDSVPSAAPSFETKVEKPTAADTVPKEFTEADPRVTNGTANRPLDYEQSRMNSTQQAPGAHGQPPAQWSETPQHPDRFQTWTTNHQNALRNVWGAPGNDRSLGNGTFNADIGPLPDSHVAAGGNVVHRPAPIAPPRATPQAPQPEAQSNRLAPIGPPRARPYPTNSWKTFDIEADDERRRLERTKHTEVLGEEASGPTFTETWRSVDLNKDGQRSLAGTYVNSKRDVSAGLQEIDKATSRLEMGRQLATAPPGPAPPTGPSAQTRTGSRFFPASKEGQQHEASTQPSSRSKSPTPPPPTADGHPVYDGDATKPHVALPPLRPRVKLPPSAEPVAPGPIAPPTKQAPVSFAAAAASNVPLRAPPEANIAGRPASRGRGFNGIPQKPHEIASQENWQSKINSLMGKKSTSPAKLSPAGTSMTAPVEFSRLHDSTDVPILSPSGTESSEDSAFTSKEMAEECFGEQEMGSLPAVRLPTETPDAAWQAVPPNWHPAPAKLRVDPVGREPFKFGFDYAHGKSVIRISTPGMSDAKTVVAPALNHRSGSNPRRAGPRGGGARHPSRGGRRGGRDALDQTSDYGPTTSSSRTISSRGARSYRPRGETWSRQASSTSTAQS